MQLLTVPKQVIHKLPAVFQRLQQITMCYINMMNTEAEQLALVFHIRVVRVQISSL
jgi:hypothetical protein